MQRAQARVVHEAQVVPEQRVRVRVRLRGQGEGGGGGRGELDVEGLEGGAGRAQEVADGLGAAELAPAELDALQRVRAWAPEEPFGDEGGGGRRVEEEVGELHPRRLRRCVCGLQRFVRLSLEGSGGVRRPGDGV